MSVSGISESGGMAMAKLLLSTGDEAGRLWDVMEASLRGSGPGADIRLKRTEADTYLIVDPHSRNGTRVKA